MEMRSLGYLQTEVRRNEILYLTNMWKSVACLLDRCYIQLIGSTYMVHDTSKNRNVLEGGTWRLGGIALQCLLKHMMITAAEAYTLVGLQKHTKTVYNAWLLYDAGKVTLKRRIPTCTIAKPKRMHCSYNCRCQLEDRNEKSSDRTGLLD